MNDTTIEPLTTEEIEQIRQGHETYGIMVVDVPRVLATIGARDKTIAERDAEIARLRQERRAAMPPATEARIAEIRARVAAIPSGAVTLHAIEDVPFLLATLDASVAAEREACAAIAREELKNCDAGSIAAYTAETVLTHILGRR